MFDRALHRYCRSVAQDISIPRPFSIGALCQELATKNGRRIYLHPFPPELGGEDMPCGVWVATAVADHIFFERNTSEYHQNHIILHEIGHMLCRHTMSSVAASVLDGGADDLGDDGEVTGALQRTRYTDRQEREAELVASMILSRVMRWDGETAAAGERYFGEVFGLA
jgi:hypothetical protein